MILRSLALACSVLSFSGLCQAAEQIYLRANQAGYSPRDRKIALAFSRGEMPASFSLVDPGGQTVFTGQGRAIQDVSWGKFSRHLELDFSSVTSPGTYLLRVGLAESTPVHIRPKAYEVLVPAFLEFMGQQRCGYNPWLDTYCHQLDGRSAYGPLTNGTFIDCAGGWHDAGDLLKYMITSGNATAQMLLAAQIADAQGGSSQSQLLEDRLDALGRPGPNGLSDLLDEARWGLDWMLKMHPTKETLCHQVADDRDHIGFRLPQNEIADYGWGKGSYRVVYFADGKPQGLAQYKSESTGMANVAGRYAAAMALAWQVFGKDDRHRALAHICLQSGIEVYELGRAKEGVQQGNSVRAPYRYEETTWADDMEWGAAELYRATKNPRYLEDAIRYAHLAGSDTWMGREQTKHYQYYPFMNAGHFRLYEFADPKLKRELAGFYREGIERCIKAGRANPYRIGVPFIWCSNNLTVALATQLLMYEMMTGDTQYREFTAKQRDWLLGRNPWGYSMFTGIGALSPKDTHLMTVQIMKRQVPGGLVDGPVYDRIFKSLKGVTITEPDPLAEFQGQAVFHDDVHDYSSNEPTMDGTAAAILLFALCE